MEQEILQLKNTVSKAITAMGITSSLISLLALPIIFMPIGVIFGIGGLFITGKADRGIIVILLAIFLGFVGEITGAGWGLGLGKFPSN